MKIFRSFLILLAISFNQQLPAMAAEKTFRPAVVWGGMKSIKKGSRAEVVTRGITKFEEKTNIAVHQVMVKIIEDYAGQIANLAQEGYSPILIPTSAPSYMKKLEKTFNQYPERQFIVTDGIYSIPNAYVISYAYQETSFLAGYLAARKTKTKKVGFIGGVDIPVIRNYLCGYIKGAYHADLNVKVMRDFVGTDFTGWNNKPRAGQLTHRQVTNGADVIYTAAGASGLGVLEAAHKLGKLGIGDNQNQNALFPGSILTSTMVHTDRTIYGVLMALLQDDRGEQIKFFGIQDGALELAFDEYNAPLISPELKRELELVQEDIVLNSISLPRYAGPTSCSIGEVLLF